MKEIRHPLCSEHNGILFTSFLSAINRTIGRTVNPAIGSPIMNFRLFNLLINAGIAAISDVMAFSNLISLGNIGEMYMNKLLATLLIYAVGAGSALAQPASAGGNNAGAAESNKVNKMSSSGYQASVGAPKSSPEEMDKTQSNSTDGIPSTSVYGGGVSGNVGSSGMQDPSRSSGGANSSSTSKTSEGNAGGSAAGNSQNNSSAGSDAAYSTSGSGNKGGSGGSTAGGGGVPTGITGAGIPGNLGTMDGTKGNNSPYLGAGATTPGTDESGNAPTTGTGIPSAKSSGASGGKSGGSYDGLFRGQSSEPSKADK